MKIGILKADDVRPELVDEYGEYPEMFHQLFQRIHPHIESVSYDVLRGQYPQDINEADAYLVTGSKFSVYEDLPWIHRLAEFIQVLHQKRKKLVGICFGHQLIAHSLGGRVEKSSRGWGIGVYKVTLSNVQQAGITDIVGETESFSIASSHQDQVVQPAIGSIVVAGNDFCPIAMTVLGQHILTLQGHPEFCRDYARGLITLRKQLYSEPHYRSAMDSFVDDLDHNRMKVAGWILQFMSRGIIN